MTRGKVFEQRVQSLTIEGAPRAAEVIPSFRLLSSIVVIQELIEDMLDSVWV